MLCSIGTYNMNSGEAALMLLPSRVVMKPSSVLLLTECVVGIGAIIAMGIFFWYDRFLARNKVRGNSWAQSEEYRRLPLACAGGPLFAISEFWLVSRL